jgi:hypothetical protein
MEKCRYKNWRLHILATSRYRLAVMSALKRTAPENKPIWGLIFFLLIFGH